MTDGNRAQPLGHRVRSVGRREFMFLLANEFQNWKLACGGTRLYNELTEGNVTFF
jgi:hypothetical protein